MGILAYILRILIYLYNNQITCIMWGDVLSIKFKVTDDVGQGGYYPLTYLFNVYVDALSKQLKTCNIICSMNGRHMNYIMYADDLVLISPSAGLSQLLHECEHFGMRHDVKYNAKKSAVIIFKSATITGCSIPEFTLKGVTLHVVATYTLCKYLGNYISDDLSDDDDIND